MSFGRAVVDGKIQYLSVSQIEKFDPASGPWGCNRAWWFRYVARLEAEQTTAQAAGEALHAQVAHYLKTGEDGLGPLARAGRHLMPEPGADLMVESPLEQVSACGIPLVGFVDLINRRNGVVEIVDWKTSSDITRYGKTPQQLLESVQMNGYALSVLNRGFSSGEVRLSHVYFQTRGAARCVRVTCITNRELVEKNWQRVEAVVRRMVEVAREKDSQNVEPNWNVCHIGRGCPYAAKCPRGDLVSDFLSRFMEAPTQISASVPTNPQPEIRQTAEAAHAQPGDTLKSTGERVVANYGDGTVAVLPPDAPKSDPALAADPVVERDITPTVAETAVKRGKGRPRKMPPIIDLSTTPDRPVTSDSPTQQAPAQTATTVTVQRIAIRYGGKINLGNYNMAEIAVELEATVTGDADTARKLLAAQAKAAFEAEVAPLKKPAGVTVEAKS